MYLKFSRFSMAWLRSSEDWSFFLSCNFRHLTLLLYCLIPFNVNKEHFIPFIRNNLTTGSIGFIFFCLEKYFNTWWVVVICVRFCLKTRGEDTRNIIFISASRDKTFNVTWYIFRISFPPEYKRNLKVFRKLIQYFLGFSVCRNRI